MKLNPGGLLLGLAIGGAAVYLMFQRPVAQRGNGFFEIAALVLGAIVGNFLWGLAFSKKK